MRTTSRQPATGFRFTPPPVWAPERYLVSELTGPGAATRQPGALSIAEIQYQPIEFSNRPEVLLRIHVFPDSAWNLLQHGEGPSLGGVAARARGRTYLASSAQSNPYTAGTKDAQIFDAMRLAIADVKRWLSVADASSDLASEFLPGSPAFGPAPVMYTGGLRGPGARQRGVKVVFRADSSAGEAGNGISSAPASDLRPPNRVVRHGNEAGVGRHDSGAGMHHGFFSAALISSRDTPSVARATRSKAGSVPLKWTVRWTWERLLPGANAAAGEDDSSS